MLYIVTSATARLVDAFPRYPKVCTDEIIYQGTSLENAIKHAMKVRGMRVYTTDGNYLIPCHEADKVIRGERECLWTS